MPIASDDALSLLFTDARTHNGWADRPVDDATLRRIYELARMAPTAANSQPLRVVFVKSAEGKERLLTAVSPGNVDKTRKAPVTAIIAYEVDFHEKLPRLFTAYDLRSALAAMPAEARTQMAIQNSSIQGGYFILAARALGLDCGPMGGFDKAKLDAEFFPDGAWKSNFLVNLGYGDPSALYPRGARLDTAEATRFA